ncbi:uncharacterized protein VTP21DRAFT_2734 [Calcarisporiella thermophila]|uniref:uncharacterized protein n=1 Tax=Calcarisporiella thermophila TaxID=911321 RepID=UPI003743A185
MKSAISYIALAALILCTQFQLVVSEKADIVGYFTSWETNIYDVNAVPWDKLSRVNFAFATVNDVKNPVPVLSPEDSKVLAKLAAAGNAHGVPILVSIGGWGGGNAMSLAVGQEANRQKFINTVKEWVTRYKLAGIDLDWEFPGSNEGCPANHISPRDNENYAMLVRQLRAALGKDKLITMAVQISPRLYGNSLKQLGQDVDKFNVMSYDVHGNWEASSGPNAPIDSFKTSLDEWSTKVPIEKIVMGTAFYGHSMKLAKRADGTTPYIPLAKNAIIKGDKLDVLDTPDSCTGEKKYTGNWSWRNLLEQGVINKKIGGGVTRAGTGWIRYFDQGSATPYLYNDANGVFISYDDPDSLRLKAAYAACRGAGVFAWELSNDDRESSLLNALSSGMRTSFKGNCEIILRSVIGKRRLMI